MMHRTLVSRIGGILFPVVLGWCAQIPSQQLVSADPSVRQAALKRLAALPAEEKLGFIPELVRLLRGKQGRLAILAFSKIGPAAAPALTSLLDDPDRLARGFATEALATLRPITTANFKNVRRMLKDKDQFVRQRAAASFLSFGIDDPEAAAIVKAEWPRKDVTESAVPALLKSLKDENPQVRADAAVALYGLHLFWPEIQTAFLQALHDPYPQVREQARRFLTFQVTATAMDAILQDDIAEAARK